MILSATEPLHRYFLSWEHYSHLNSLDRSQPCPDTHHQVLPVLSPLRPRPFSPGSCLCLYFHFLFSLLLLFLMTGGANTLWGLCSGCTSGCNAHTPGKRASEMRHCCSPQSPKGHPQCLWETLWIELATSERDTFVTEASQVFISTFYAKLSCTFTIAW